MPDVVDIAPKPPLLSPEREAEIYESSRKAGKQIGDVLVAGVSKIADAAAAGQAEEIEALRARVAALEAVTARLERLLAPREVEGRA